MIISTTALTLAASAPDWAVGFSLFIAALRRRWFSGFAHGFFSPAIAVAGAAAMSAMVVGRSARSAIAIGVGIHTAEAIVGYIGSTRRLEYTVIGDGVNTSSRVQALNKEFGCPALRPSRGFEETRTHREGRARGPALLTGPSHSGRSVSGRLAREFRHPQASTRPSSDFLRAMTRLRPFFFAS